MQKVKHQRTNHSPLSFKRGAGGEYLGRSFYPSLGSRSHKPVFVVPSLNRDFVSRFCKATFSHPQEGRVTHGLGIRSIILNICYNF